MQDIVLLRLLITCMIMISISWLLDSTSMYMELIEKCLAGLKREESLFEYNGRFMYFYRAKIIVGDKKRKGYGYLGMDVDRSTDEIHKVSQKTGDKKKPAEEMYKIITNAGLFGLLSFLP